MPNPVLYAVRVERESGDVYLLGPCENAKGAKDLAAGLRTTRGIKKTDVCYPTLTSLLACPLVRSHEDYDRLVELYQRLATTQVDLDA